MSGRSRLLDGATCQGRTGSLCGADGASGAAMGDSWLNVLLSLWHVVKVFWGTKKRPNGLIISRKSLKYASWIKNCPVWSDCKHTEGERVHARSRGGAALRHFDAGLSLSSATQSRRHIQGLRMLWLMLCHVHCPLKPLSWLMTGPMFCQSTPLLLRCISAAEWEWLL